MLEDTVHIVLINMHFVLYHVLSVDLGYPPRDIGSDGSLSILDTGSSVHRIYTIPEYYA